MDKDTFTMEDVKELELESVASEEPTTEEKPEAEPEEKASFIDSFKKAKGEKVALTEPEPEPEKPKEGEGDTPESRSSSDFKLIKTERDDARQKMTELEDKLKSLENNDVDSLLKETQQERDKLSEQLRITSIERHPDFVRKYDAKVGQVVQNAKNTVGDHNAENIERLLLMEDSDLRTDGIEEIFGELSPTRQAKLGAFLAEVDNIRSERSATLADHEESYKLINANEDARRDAHFADSNALFDEVLEEAKNLEIYKTREGDDDWNGQVKDRINQARILFCGESTSGEVARASLWAAAAPQYRELLIQQVELNRRLQAQIKGEGGANPSVSTAGGEGAAEAKTFMEVFGEHTGMDVTK